MQTNKNTPYYLVAAVLFILLKFTFIFAGNRELIFFLKPSNALIGLLTGSQSVYLPDGGGYYNEQLNIIIDKSCSGFNFWLLAFMLFTYLSIKYFDRILSKIGAISLALPAAYFLSIFVNTSRIYVSILVQTHTKNIFQNEQHMIHEVIGIITNLTFLILAYIFIEKILKTKRYNAKFT